MKHENRLILDEEQKIRIHLAGAKITMARRAGSFGFSSAAADEDVIELRHDLDSSSEPIFITRALFQRIREGFRVLNMHRLRAEKAKKTLTE